MKVHSNNLMMLVIAVIIACGLACYSGTSECYAEADIASGNYEGADWRITADYDLIIGKEGCTQNMGESTGEGRNPEDYPWHEYRDIIKSVRFDGTVKAYGRLTFMCFNMKSANTIDCTGLDTANVIDMSGMFTECDKATVIDVSGFDTANVEMMSNMFYNCKSAASLDVSGFDTRNVFDFGFMFGICRNLESLDVSHFNTSKARKMDGMFTECNSLRQIDISGFDTSNVETMSSMFYYCEQLESLDLSHLDTGKVTDFRSMFDGCKSLKNADVSGFDTSSATDMGYMFAECGALTNIDISHFNTSGVTDMSYMFIRSGIQSIDLSVHDLTKVRDMSYMFNSCSNLKSVKMSGLDLSRVTVMPALFAGCTSLENVELDNINTVNVIDMKELFSGCTSLRAIDLSALDTALVYNMEGMFRGCTGLSRLDLSTFDMTDVTGSNEMLKNVSLEQLSVPLNLNSLVELDKPMADEAGTSYSSLPKNLTESIILYKIEEPEPVEKLAQTITVPAKTYAKTTNSSAFYLKASAKTKLSYSTSNAKVATVDAAGKVAIKGYGKATITIKAAENDQYKPASIVVTVTATFAKPTLKAVNQKGRKVKLTWSKINGADGYLIYIKGPKDKSYRLRLTKSAKVKSVTHKGLKKKKNYRYRIRAYKTINGKRVYSPYSVIRTVKIKK